MCYRVHCAQIEINMTKGQCAQTVWLYDVPSEHSLALVCIFWHVVTQSAKLDNIFSCFLPFSPTWYLFQVSPPFSCYTMKTSISRRLTLKHSRTQTHSKPPLHLQQKCRRQVGTCIVSSALRYNSKKQDKYSPHTCSPSGDACDRFVLQLWFTRSPSTKCSRINLEVSNQ